MRLPDHLRQYVFQPARMKYKLPGCIQPYRTVRDGPPEPFGWKEGAYTLLMHSSYNVETDGIVTLNGEGVIQLLTLYSAQNALRPEVRQKSANRTAAKVGGRKLVRPAGCSY